MGIAHATSIPKETLIRMDVAKAIEDWYEYAQSTPIAGAALYEQEFKKRLERIIHTYPGQSSIIADSLRTNLRFKTLEGLAGFQRIGMRGAGALVSKAAIDGANDLVFAPGQVVDGCSFTFNGIGEFDIMHQSHWSDKWSSRFLCLPDIGLRNLVGDAASGEKKIVGEIKEPRVVDCFYKKLFRNEKIGTFKAADPATVTPVQVDEICSQFEFIRQKYNKASHI